MADTHGEGRKERSANKKKVCAKGSLEPSQGPGRWEKRNHWVWQERVWEPDVGAEGWGRREGVGSSRVMLQSLDFVPKSRKQHGQQLGGHSGCPWGWAGGAGLWAGRPLDGA